jgi:hypothetical protein
VKSKFSAYGHFWAVQWCGHRNRFFQQTLNLSSLIPSGSKVLNKKQEPGDENPYASKDEKDDPKILFAKADVSHNARIDESRIHRLAGFRKPDVTLRGRPYDRRDQWAKCTEKTACLERAHRGSCSNIMLQQRPWSECNFYCETASLISGTANEQV